MAYATIDDFLSRCNNAPSRSEIEIAEVLLEDAADRIRAEFNRHRKDPVETCDAYTLQRISCEMVLRVMNSRKQSDDFISSGNDAFMQESWYDFNGQLRLTADDLRDLGLSRNVTKAAFVSAYE